jgi:hypothetical protein
MEKTIIKELNVKAKLIEAIGKKSNRPYKAVQLTFEEDGKQPIDALFFPENDRLKLRLGMIEDK